ncbi:MAG: hypothetical protein IJW16_08785 [Clostridia bacterium]|nr:hypothetical protein [Clostridia bacterium]
MEKRNVKWHKMTASAAVAQLHTNAAYGLTRRAARSRLRKFGSNTLFEVGSNGFWSVWRSILADPAMLLLLFSAFLAVFFSDIGQTVCMLIALVCTGAVTVRFTSDIVALHRTVALYRVPSTYVLREGRVFEISARSVVPGDIVLLQKGDVVPADCRILDVDGRLCTRLVCRDGMGRRTVLEQVKNGDTVYPYESRVFAPNCENILYGKSEIIEGTVRAVITEVGDYTYIGAMQRSVPVATEERAALKRTMAELLPYLRILSLFLFVLLIPMTIIGLLTAPDGQGAMRTFLPMGLLCGLGAQSLLLLFFHTVLARGYRRCIRKSDSRAVPKSVGAIDKLADMTDLIILGRSASSDGIMHLYRAALGNGEVALDAHAQPQLAPLCEALELLFRAPAASLSASQQKCTVRDLEDPVLREELRRISKYDLDILTIRLKRATAYYQSDRILLEVEFKDLHQRYCFTDRVGLLYSCTDYEKDGQVYPLDSANRANLIRFFEASVKEGGRPTIIIRQHGERAVLLGILSCREQMQPFLPSVQEELAQSGVRVTYFLPTEDTETRNYVNAAKLFGAVCCKSELEEGESLIDRFADHRILLGFTDKEIRTLIRACKQKGCRIAVWGSHAEASLVQTEADLRIATDPLTADLRRAGGGLQNSIPVESGFFDGQYSRSLSLHANLLLPHATERGGGLASFLHALSAARAVRFRMRLLCRYFAIMLPFRIAMIFFSACFGTGLISGAQLLWSGLLFDLFALLWILRTPISQDRLRERTRLDERFLFQTVTDKGMLLPSLLTPTVLCIYTFIFSCIGWIGDAAAITYHFYSVLAVEGIIFFRCMRRENAWRFSKREMILSAVLLLPPLAITGLSFLLPALRTACELGDFSIASILSLPLAPLLYFLFVKIAPKLRFVRKKRK